MTKEIICIVCPRGCKLNVEKMDNEIKVTGNTCKRGEEFAKEEVTDPKRTLTTTLKTTSFEMPTISVRSSSPVSRRLFFDIQKTLKNIKVDLPIKRGDIIVENILNTGCNIIATEDGEENGK